MAQTLLYVSKLMVPVSGENFIEIAGFPVSSVFAETNKPRFSLSGNVYSASEGRQ